MKLQSAMEYLTTYGWAILILAIVLIALFKFNIFNPNSATPKMQPGLCIVDRNIYSGAQLSGNCLSGLPKFVAQFDGSTSYIAATSPYSSVGGTISLWVDRTGPGTGGDTPIGSYTGVGNERAPTILLSANNFGWEFGSLIGQPTTVTWNTNTWYYVVMTYDSNFNVNFYVNGVLAGSGTSVDPFPLYSPFTLGKYGNFGVEYFQGYISNVQVYNTSLSANSVQSLYTEGIGGIPINLKNLVSWWPLNDDANDYSGVSNDAVPINIFYTASWTNGYTQPT